MGKSGARKKKGANNVLANGDHHAVQPRTPSPAETTAQAAPAPPPPPVAVNGVELDSSMFTKRAHELKEEGNRRFQSKDYVGALQQYEMALKLTPRTHPDRAVFHSNRAACLMQMRPVNHEAVAAECSLALQAQPQFPRALLRRARALEALGRYDLASQDVQVLLAADPANRDALDLARRLRHAAPLAHQDSNGSRPSPAALGASAVGAPIAGLGPCLPARPVSKKPSFTPSAALQPITISKPGKLPTLSEDHRSSNCRTQASPKPVDALSGSSLSCMPGQVWSESRVRPVAGKAPSSSPEIVATRWRPLKLVYDHDIRLAQMPANCSFKALRDVVAKRFPSSKSVLIKYKDADGDLVTITSTSELRLAESCVDLLALGEERKTGSSEMDKDGALQGLRLHIVEVSHEQEPPLPEEDEKPIGDEGLIQVDESPSHSPTGDTSSESINNGIVRSGSEEEEVPKAKAGKECHHAECKEVDIDDWLYEFAQMFRTQVGIDPDSHLDLHEIGMELCSEALEETVTSEEAQGLFDMAAAKFQEVAALAFFNWGNVHMCAARKRIPLDESSSKEVMAAQLQDAYDWVRERYALAGQKYEEALRIKPDFYEGLLALGQQHFETAKLHWSFALANKVDLKAWDSADTIKLFDSAEEKMKGATDMWEKVEEQRTAELKDPLMIKKDELLKKRRKQAGITDIQELSADEAAEQAAVMRSQIHLFWGNMLFERSQVEFQLGMLGWKKNLDAAVERFKLAGASETDISVVLKNHSSNGDPLEGDKKKAMNVISDASETLANGEDKHEPNC